MSIPRHFSASDVFARVLHAAHCGLLLLGTDRRIHLWNDWMVDHSGIQACDALGSTLVEVFPELDNTRLASAIDEALTQGKPALLSQSLNRAPFPLFLDEGRRQRLEQSIRITALEAGGERYCMVQITDMTAATAREQVLRRKATQLREEQLRQLALLHGIPDMAWLKDREGRFVAVNQRFADELGTTPDAMIGKTDYDVWAHQLADRFRSDGMQVMETGEPLMSEFPLELPGRGKRWIEKISVPVLDDAGRAIGSAGVARDITERRQTEEHIRHLAHYDPLTGLANRTLLADRLEVSLASARRSKRLVAVLFLDLDRFKIINDSLGHDVGDALLQQVAKRLKECAREVDTVARLGGDEFVVALHEIREPDKAAWVARKILHAFDAPFMAEGNELRTSPSIGISLFPDHGKDIETLLKNADTAMYQAKANGRNQYEFYSPALQSSASSDLTIVNGLRESLERGTFVLHFQQQVEIVSGRISGMEAQLRWLNRDLGMVPPSQFIPIAESSGLIVPIGAWVLRAACRQNRQWQQQGLPFVPVSVNLSAVQLRQKNFVATVLEVLEETGLAPRYLELEITESSIMHDTQMTGQILDELKRIGVRLSIDDFGTGYSSLSYLKRLPIDKLKIDRSFVQDITTDPDDAAITSAIIALAKNMKLRVTAEGVETKEQLAFLAGHDCDEVQGFFHGRPRPAEEFSRMLEAGIV